MVAVEEALATFRDALVAEGLAEVGVGVVGVDGAAQGMSRGG